MTHDDVLQGQADMSSSVPRREAGSGWDLAGEDGGIVTRSLPGGSGGVRTDPPVGATEKAAIVLLEIMAPR